MKNNDIAIISMACRLPDADNIEMLWKNISLGKSAVKEIPTDRWRLNKFYSERKGDIGKSNTKKGTFLDNIKSFDPTFFGLKPQDAFVMDPQQRILIELAYELIYSTKYSEKDLAGKKIAVYLGITKSDYREYVQEALIREQLKQSTAVIGVLQNMIAARISHLFDFQGPALTIDTACSSSLVALHLAKESILSGTAEMAMVGGINLNLIPAPYLGMSAAGALSPGEHYHVFDQRSDGFFMGEGGGLILIKKLSQAIIDKDNVLGVIKGSAINNDGRSFSPMAPRPATQQALLEEVYNNSSIKPEDVDYIESHGTGTFIGDAIEAQTLIKTFKNNNSEIFLGSIKPNIGHLLSGAGIAGIIKILLILQNRKIPPLINHQQPRTELGLENAGFILNNTIKEFKKNKLITAGINGFGFGGTNAHIIIQEYPEQKIFKQFSPAYNKKDYWLDIDFSLDKKYLIESDIKGEKVFIPEWIEKNNPAINKLPENIITIESPFYNDFQNKLIESSKNNISLLTLEDIKKNINNKTNLLILFPKSYQYLLKIMQEINKLNNKDQIEKITIVTEQSILLPDDEIIENTNKFLTAGLIFALTSEFDSINIKHIDLAKKDLEELKIKQILKELSFDSEDIVVYRDNKKYIRQFNDFYLDIKQSSNKLSIKEDGVYLITGASSGIGLEITKSILLKAKVSLILVGRRNKSEIKEWQELIRLAKNNHSKIEYFPIDISDKEEIEILFEQINNKYTFLNGVIHAAGIAKPELFNNKTLSSFENTLKPKVNGIELLNKQIEINNFKIDFFITFSSISSIITGYAGMISDYAVANYYLEQYCLLQQKKQKPFQVINWGPWQEQGMVADNKYLLEQMSNKGIKPISTNKGLNIFWSVINKKIPHIIVANTNLPFSELNLKSTKSEKFVNKKNDTEVVFKQTKKVENKAINTIEQSIQKLLIDIIKDELSEISLVDQININDNLLDLGIDSLSAMEIIARLGKSGFKDLPFELIFENQTIKDISSYLLKQSPDYLDEPLKVEKDIQIIEEIQSLISDLSTQQTAFLKAHTISESPNFSYTRQTVKEKLDINIMDKALKIVLSKHDLLRANIFIIKETGKIKFEQKINDLESYISDSLVKYLPLDNSLEVIENNFVNQKFDLEKDLLIKLGIIEDIDKSHLLILAHHIIFDGISMNIFIRDLWDSYIHLLSAKEIEINKPLSSYYDYITYIDNLKDEKRFEDSLNWWKTNFKNLKSMKNLENLNDINSESKSSFFKIPSDIYLNINKFIKNNKVSHQFLLLTIFSKTLSEWFKIENIIVNLAINGRNHNIKEINNIIGCFADTLPVYIDFENKKNTLEISQNLRNQWNNSKQYHNINSSEILKILKEDNLQFSPFAFSFSSFNKEWADNLPFEIIETNVRGYNSNTRFAIQIWEDLETFNYTLNYPDQLLNDKKIESFNQLFLENIKKTIEITTKKTEKSEKINNQIIDRFLASVKNYPDKQAIIYQSYSNIDGEILTYQELNKQIDLIAGAINKIKNKDNPAIAIIGTASAKTTVTLMAILKSGGIYIPIEKDYPIYRIEDMLKISKAEMIIFTDDFPNQKKIPNIPTFTFDQLIAENTYIKNIDQIDVNDNAYIIFTSGSTGKPKGVPITYQSLFNYLEWCINTFKYTNTDNIIQISSISFDASLRQIIVPLMTGATLFPLATEIKLDIKELYSFIKNNKITVWSSVPSLWEKFVSYAEKQKYQDLNNLRMIKVGGESLSVNLLKRWQNLYGIEKPVINLYGPTEATVNTTYHLIDYLVSEEISNLPIGKLLPYYQAKIIDNQSVKSEEKGELCISGLGITAGYLNDQNPDKFFIDDQGNKFYKTGDIVSQNQSGEYIFHGRTDRQVKIRGFRVELEEIEHILTEHPLITFAVVELIKLKNGNQQLIAFICLRYNFITIEEIKEYLLKEVPEYIIPNKIEIIDKMPLLTNGKIDRKSLLNNFSENNNELQADNFDTKNIVANLWQKTLNTNKVNNNSDFFNDGGDSLLLMQLFMDLEEFFIKLPKIATFYKQAKFSNLIELINSYPENIKNNDLDINKDELKLLPIVEKFPLSPAQTGFYFSHKYLNGDNSYWKASFYLKGKLDLDLWKKSLEILQVRHQMLNVKLINENPPYFQYLTKSELFFEYIDSINNQKVYSKNEFDLEKGYPLIKHTLNKINQNEFIWNITAHHILADGLSSLIFGKEQFYIYNQLVKNQEINLPVLKSQFSDYSFYIKENMLKNAYKDNLYWLDIFKDIYSEPNLAVISENKDFFSLKNELSENLWHQVIQKSKLISSTPFIILLTAFYQTIAKYTKQKDIIIGIANHNRDYPIADIQNIFGCFAQALPIRINQNNINLETVNDIFSKSLNHSLNPIEIIKRIKPGTKLKSLLGSQFFFSYLDFTNWQKDLTNQVIQIDWNQSESLFKPGNNDNDIFFTVKKINEKIELHSSFNQAHFGQDTAEQVMNIFIQKLENLLKEPEKNINNLRIENKPFELSDNKIDSLLIAYLPALKSLPVNTDIANSIKNQLFNDQKVLWTEIIKTSLGNSATLLLPFFAEEIIPANRELINQYIEEAFKLSNQMNVKYISLAGMLPSVMGFNTNVLGSENLNITTGHSSTVAAIIKTFQKVLKETEINLSEITITFIGLGSIGKATLYTMLSLDLYPKKIILSDLFGTKKQLEDIEKFIYENFNFKGEIIKLMTDNNLPEEAYNTNIMISAVSKSNVIDIDKLKAGTIVIDDSFPYCFDTKKAMERMENKKDILVTGGGLLRVETYQRKIYFPESINQYISNLLAKSFIPDTLASCQFESLLLSKDKNLKATNGLADYRQVKEYIISLNNLEIEPAPFHIGKEIIDETILNI